MGYFQNTHEILQELNISWENLSKQIQLKIWDLKIEGSEGNHGVLEFGGSGVCFQGCSLALDHMIACWMHSYLDCYFQEIPSKAQRKVFTSFDFAFLMKGLKILRFNDEAEGGLNNEWDWKGWLRIYLELNDRPKILEQLSDQSGGFLKHLDLLVEENLLNVVSRDLYISSQSGHNNMFFCSQVASEEEVYKMSILQSLLLSLNLLLPKCKQNAQGWNLIALGLYKI